MKLVGTCVGALCVLGASAMNAQAEDDQRDINGFGFGAGIAIQLGQNAVDKAELDEAHIVRVTQEADARVGIVLEGHYLFDMWQTEGERSTDIGLGPFLAVQTGDNNNIIDSVGLGVMMGLSRHDRDERGWGNSFNIGLGVMFDPTVQKLGDGIVANEPLPAEESQIRYRQEHAYRGVIMITYSP